ncbi:hypothetical protein TPHA_0I02980 [Tetrapisispora phaffii CBS 4417]|uniref:Uncharacterized protein n=1 Tax=Tetrapisispora phaffii (strain ATCC 24235 / CBS 4417 / NBRC 1672 / NRRL Y-8282 / UCD 70-5) TaxID=1071381 RepID=G8BY21_TETPH|nr:hypothetical protein TPHA_0I02980 [Tetrapisispora phaffii CBS 4417]CCE64799.1 hypothetical protein TPHA_0I02980 [Tetrapisispora phaffii CBS 4417]
MNDAEDPYDWYYHNQKENKPENELKKTINDLNSASAQETYQRSLPKEVYPELKPIPNNTASANGVRRQIEAYDVEKEDKTSKKRNAIRTRLQVINPPR